MLSGVPSSGQGQAQANDPRYMVDNRNPQRSSLCRCPSLTENQRFGYTLLALAVTEAATVVWDINNNHTSLPYSESREQYPIIAIVGGGCAWFGQLLLSSEHEVKPTLISCALGATAMLTGIWGCCIKMYASGLVDLAAGAVVTAWAAKRLSHLNVRCYFRRPADAVRHG